MMQDDPKRRIDESPCVPKAEGMSKGLAEEQAVFEEAADWLLTLENVPDGAPILEEFEAWLSSSECHRYAWKRVNRTWSTLGAGLVLREKEERDFPAAVAFRRSISGRGKPGRSASVAIRRRPYRALSGLGLAMAVVGMAWLVAPNVLMHIRADHITAAGEIERVQLADGSMIDLGGSSAISIDVNTQQRRVTLLDGEAFFDIAADAARPFVVDARGLKLRVLGTAFDVELTSSSTTVALLHGSIQVDSVAGHPARILRPGEMLQIDQATGTVTTGVAYPEDIGAWREGRVFLADVTIGAVVEMIQRYHTAWISIPDRGLAAQKVSGLFDLRDPDAALTALVHPFGGKVHSLTPFVRVITRF